MSLTVSASILLLVCGMTAGLTREYFYFNKYYNWSYARMFCRNRCKDLATITSETEKRNALNSFGTSKIESWIGLNRREDDMWTWSDEENVNFVQPYLDTALTDSRKRCVKINSLGWNVDDCTSKHHFLCYTSFFLVKLNKTWEDALRYCRKHYTSLAYASFANRPFVIQNEAAEVQTASVWTGLRFMDGRWFWVSMRSLQVPDELPKCPAQNYSCGARNTKTEVWENRDCNQKFNFICYLGYVPK